MKITTTVEIPPRRIADMMVTAIESGISYWCESVKLKSAFGLFKVGEQYSTLAAKKVKLIGVAGAGTTFETMFDEDNIHRYTNRDFGRVTGTDFNNPDPRNIEMPIWYDHEEIFRDRSYNEKDNLVPELRIEVTEREPSSDKNKDGIYVIYLADLEAAFKMLQTFGEGKSRGYCWRDFINENEDANTADVWFQLTVFGEVVYG